MASGFRFDPAQLVDILNAKEQRALFALETAGRTGAAQMEHSAKEGRPWDDRSGNARDTIQGKAERTGSGVRITLSGNMYYSVYLEFAMKKRWAILWPTISQMGPEILNQIARLQL